MDHTGLVTEDSEIYLKIGKTKITIDEYWNIDTDFEEVVVMDECGTPRVIIKIHEPVLDSGSK